MSSMRKSTFCMVPKGWYHVTNRMMEVFYAGCIPVSIGADQLKLPFLSMINYDKVVVWISEADMDSIDNVLSSFTEEEIIKRQMMIREMSYEGTAYTRNMDPNPRKLWLKSEKVEIEQGRGTDAIEFLMLELVGQAMKIGALKDE